MEHCAGYQASKHEDALSGVKDSKAAEARTKEKPLELATKKMQAALDYNSGTEPETAAHDSKLAIKQRRSLV